MTKPDVILTLLGRFAPVPLKPISDEPIASELAPARGFAAEKSLSARLGLVSSN
jgi:hypothetical protein